MRNRLPDLKGTLKALGHGQRNVLGHLPFGTQEDVTGEWAIRGRGGELFQGNGLTVTLRGLLGQCGCWCTADKGKDIVVGGIGRAVGDSVDGDLLDGLAGYSVDEFDALGGHGQVDARQFVVASD